MVIKRNIWILVFLLCGITVLDLIGQGAGFENMDRELNRHRVEVEMFNNEGELFGYSLEAVEAVEGERVVYISMLGADWMSGDYLEDEMEKMDCAKNLIQGVGDDEGRLFWFVMVKDRRKSMGMCVCRINVWLSEQLMSLKSG